MKVTAGALVTIVFGEDPIQHAIHDNLLRLEQGLPIDDSVERQYVDLKEEHGRRDKSGMLGESQPHNEGAAKELAAAATCMANTKRGGSLIVGVSNHGDLIGTDLDLEWLRQRIWELSDRQLTADVQEVTVQGQRILVLRAPQAIQPIRFNGKIRWRVGSQCVEIDASTWHAQHMADRQYDWSSEASNIPVDQVRPAALSQARDLLLASGEPHAEELAQDTDANLLRRLNVVTPTGNLTNAGVLAFVGRGDPCLDFVRRDYAGGDSLVRVRRRDRSLLEELAEVFQALEATTPTVHRQQGLVIGQERQIPSRAAREAVVNGVAHRSWNISDPTVVESVGHQLRVTSPGGFVGGVTPDNILTHPSRSRNKALAELLAALRVAEREGVGVDRMTRDMIRVGHGAPEIVEIEGPYVRATLIGGDVDAAWIAWLRSIEPASTAKDLNQLLIVRRLVTGGWIDAAATARLIQDSYAVARSTVNALSRASLNGRPLLVAVDGIPEGQELAWRLSSEAVNELRDQDVAAETQRIWPGRESVAVSYAAQRGRISSTELGSLLGMAPTNVGQVLKDLEQQGVLRPSWPSRRGRGFHYLPASTGE